MDDPLVRMFFDASSLSESSNVVWENGPATRRFGGQFEHAVRHDLMYKLDPRVRVVSRRTKSPDLLFTLVDGTSLVGVEVKAWSPSRNSLSSRIAESLNAAVQARRSVADDIALVLLALVLPPGPQANATRDEVLHRTTELIRKADGVGYDFVLVGFAGPESTWYSVDADETQGPASYDQVIDTLLEEVAGRTEEVKPPPGQASVLLVGDEWGSSFGGISTLNREMAIGLAANGFQVAVIVPHASSDEIENAAAAGVSIFSPPPVPGLEGKELLLSRVQYPSDFDPGLIVGHGRTLGPYAMSIQSSDFPTSKRLHVVHTDAERLEAVKHSDRGSSPMTKADERRRLEVELAASSQLVAGIGPLLEDMIHDELLGRAPGTTVFRIVPQLREWGALADPDKLPKSRRFLVLGRAEDIEVKGLDLAMRSLSAASHRFTGDTANLELIVRGVLPLDEKRIKRRLRRWAGDARFHLRPYSTLQSDLRDDLFAATTLLLPSRLEGFGLSAWEAIAAGVPVLVSEASGVARLIQEVDPGAPEIQPMIPDENRVIEAWSDAILRNATDPAAAFARAAELREKMLGMTWSVVANDIRKRLS